MIEDTALYLFLNILFSIARFREVTGVYSIRITVVGHERRPKLLFTCEGVPLANAFLFNFKDLSGCHAPLSQKRAGRNFHTRTRLSSEGVHLSSESH